MRNLKEMTEAREKAVEAMLAYEEIPEPMRCDKILRALTNAAQWLVEEEESLRNLRKLQIEAATKRRDEALETWEMAAEIEESGAELVELGTELELAEEDLRVLEGS